MLATLQTQKIIDMYVILVIFVSALIVYYTIVSYKEYKKFENISNGKYFWPLIGHAGIIFIENLRMLTVIGRISDNGKLLPSMIWVGNYGVYLTTDANEIQILLNHKNSIEKHWHYRFLKESIANALLTADASTWHKKRKVLSKAFRQSFINSFFSVFSEKFQILTNIIKTKNEDVLEILTNYTMDVFLSTNIGISFDVQRRKLKLVDYLSQVEIVAAKRIIMPLYWNNHIFYKLSIGKKMRCILNYLDDYFMKIVKDKQGSSTCRFENESWKSLIDVLIEPSDEFQFSDYEIVKELILFIIAATNTSSTTIAMICVLLGMHKNIQEKVYDEVIDVFGIDREITSTDLHKLKYTEMVINESMRIFPSLPIIGRNLTGDINIGTKVLPKGLDIDIPIFYLHRSEKYWPNPLKFDPNRFLPEEIAKRPACSFIPFSIGPRNCIGATYARTLIKYSVASIVRAYKLSSNYKNIDEIKVEMHVTLKPDDKLDVVFIPRTENN